MRTNEALHNKKPDVLKAEYYELMLRILDLWLKIPPEHMPTPQQEFELGILEELAMEYIAVMNNRGIYLADRIGGDV